MRAWSPGTCSVRGFARWWASDARSSWRWTHDHPDLIDDRIARQKGAAGDVVKLIDDGHHPPDVVGPHALPPGSNRQERLLERLLDHSRTLRAILHERRVFLAQAMGGGQISSAAVEVTTGLGEPLREHDIPPLAGERLSMPQLGSSSRTAPR